MMLLQIVVPRFQGERQAASRQAFRRDAKLRCKQECEDSVLCSIPHRKIVAVAATTE
jgi:hypothetical protein